MQKQTILVHKGRGNYKKDGRCVNAPLMRASTVLFRSHKSWDDVKMRRKKERVLSYGALGTSTNFELEKLLCELEGGYRASLYPTGLAALAMVLINYAEVGAHFLITDGIYEPVRDIDRLFLSKIGVEVEYLKADASDIAQKLRPNTKLLLCESPGSVLYEIIDLPKVSALAHANGTVVAIDSTYSSSYLSQPLSLGADISVVAATKYLGGHSDLTMGAIIVNEKEWRNFNKLPEALGFTASPDDAYLVLRGARSLDVRLQRHEENADKVVEFLLSLPKIAKIYYPKLSTHEGHEVFMRDFSGANGMVTIELDKDVSKDKVDKFFDSLELFGIGASWGGFESLAMIAKPPRTRADISGFGTLIRFSIGLENVDDIISDLSRAFKELD